MTPLREAMTRAMQMRGFSERTHHGYLMAVTDLARWTKRSPADLSPVQVNDYFDRLPDRGIGRFRPALRPLRDRGPRLPRVP